MKIYGMDVSNPTNKVRYVANALGLEYELIPKMPFSEDVQNDEYRQLHPAEKVPSLEDGDFKLFESNAIIRYLARREQSSMYPSELQAQAKVDQWLDYVAVHIRGAVIRVFWNRLGVKFMKQEPDQNSLETGLKFLDRFLPVIDQQLGQGKYLTGEILSIADISLLAELDGTEYCGIDLTPYKNLSAWRQDLQAQEFYQVDRSRGEAMMQELMAQK